MPTGLRTTYLNLRLSGLVALLVLAALAETHTANAQEDPVKIQVQVDADESTGPLPETRYPEAPRRRSSAARDIARDDEAPRANSRENSRSRRPANASREASDRQAEFDNDQNEFEELPQGRQVGRNRYNDDRDDRYDDRNVRPPRRDRSGASGRVRDYREPEPLSGRDRDYGDYDRGPGERRSYDRDGNDREYDDRTDSDRRPPPRRRGLLRERLRERLDDARENPEEFAERVETIIRGADQLRSALAPRDYPNEASDVFGPGRERGPSLGVTLNTRTSGRVRISRVRPGSPAARAGLQPGDEILLVDGRRVSSADLLVQYLAEIEAVEEVELVVRRAGQELTVWADLSPQTDEPTNLPTDEVYESNSTGERYRDRNTGTP